MERDERYSKTQLAVNIGDYAHLIFWDLYHTHFLSYKEETYGVFFKGDFDDYAANLLENVERIN
jgi:hypothetical protein